MKDKILEELWKVKDEMSKEHGDNLERLFHSLKESEKQRSAVIVNFSKPLKGRKNQSKKAA